MQMSKFTQPKVLIFYSNPSDTARIRLDKEHRAMDMVLQRLNLDPSLIYRRHATSVDDFAHALSERDYEIVQFSGHGSDEGIYLEDPHVDGSIFISAEQISTILAQTSPNLKAAIFISCYSASSIPTLVQSASYLISVSESADDESAIEFIGAFYEAYFRSGSIEKAFGQAQAFLTFQKKDAHLYAILSRRAMEQATDRVLFQVFPANLDSLLIDITEAETDIESLDVSRDYFLSLLSRKIRVHKWTFNAPRERVILSVGPYFGLFSWKNVNDVVYCHKIMKIKPEVDEKTCEAWASLNVDYNDHYVDEYRSAAPEDPNLPKHIKKAIRAYYSTFDVFFDEGWQANYLRNIVPNQFKVTRSVISANLRMCDLKFNQDDYPSSVMYLETILSSIHDLIDAITGKVAE